MRALVIGIVVVCFVAAGVVVRSFNPDDEVSWPVRLLEIALASVALFAAFGLPVPKWGQLQQQRQQGGDVEPTGAWVTPTTPLNLGDHVLAPDAGTWRRGEVTALHSDGMVSVRYVGLTKEPDRPFDKVQLRLEGVMPIPPAQTGQAAPPSPPSVGRNVWEWVVAVFIALALLGLFLSLISHLCAVFGLRQPLGGAAWLLHFGIFAVIIPGGMVAGMRWGNKAAAAGRGTQPQPPPQSWLERLLPRLFVYAIVNFCTFMVMAAVAMPRGGGGGEEGAPTPSVVFRGFSGHWMIFYAAGAGMLWAAAFPAAGGTPAATPNPPDVPPDSPPGREPDPTGITPATGGPARP